MTDYSNIPSQFDGITNDRPVVFISYSWDSDEHKQWVRRLSDSLRTKYGVYTLLDQYNRSGFDLIQFMTKGLSVADRVLIIGTPTYKQKSDRYESGGGVKYEDQLVTIELYKKLGTSKFIPVLREGKFDTAFNSLMETRTGHDMRDDANFGENLRTLAADLWNDPLNAAPALGPKPTFLHNSFDNQTSVEQEDVSKEEFVKEIKRLLSMPNGEIAYTELVEGEAKKAYKIILEHAHYDFSVTPATFEQYMNWHKEAVDKLVAAAIIVTRYGTLKQQQLFVNAMVMLCTKPFKDGEMTREGTYYLHLFAATLLFHAVGVVGVKFGYYQIYPSMMTAKVPAKNAISPSYGFSLAFMAGTAHWDSTTFNENMQSSWLYPYSELIMRTLHPYFQEYVTDLEEFRYVYATWEHLFSLMFEHYGCNYVKETNFPTGLFVRTRISLYRQEDNFYTNFFGDAAVKKGKWEPLQQGLFDGSYDTYAEVYALGEEYFKKHGRF